MLSYQWQSLAVQGEGGVIEASANVLRISQTSDSVASRAGLRDQHFAAPLSVRFVANQAALAGLSREDLHGA